MHSSGDVPCDEHGTRIKHIKVYPLLVHELKSMAGNLLRYAPTTVSSLDHKILAIKHLLKKLVARKDQLGGYRIEVTVQGQWENIQGPLAEYLLSPEGLGR